MEEITYGSVRFSPNFQNIALDVCIYEDFPAFRDDLLAGVVKIALSILEAILLQVSRSSHEGGSD